MLVSDRRYITALAMVLWSQEESKHSPSPKISTKRVMVPTVSKLILKCP